MDGKVIKDKIDFNNYFMDMKRKLMQNESM